MSIFPLQEFLSPLAQNPWTYIVFGLIGFGFGFVLESAGFGNSKVLSAQFYFKNLTVLKVMFGAIVTAMVLTYLASAVGILDINLVYIPETYLWSGLLGGAIMGVGFIIGGFCPGTSLVSASTGKIDGVFFVIGALIGIFAFGETEIFFDGFWHSGYYGRLTLMDVFNLPTGVVVLLVVLMALFMFWGAEKLESRFGKRDLSKEPRRRWIPGAVLAALAMLILVIGQPDTNAKWAKIAPQKSDLLTTRAVMVHPGELLATMTNDTLNPILLDVRSEADYNLFHIRGARNIQLDQLNTIIPELLGEAASNTVVMVMSNDEAGAIEAWKQLTAESVTNVYILEGGLNNWLKTFAGKDPGITPTPTPGGDDSLEYTFPAALGARYDASFPHPEDFNLEYTPKIKLEIKRSPSGGGCG